MARKTLLDFHAENKRLRDEARRELLGLAKPPERNSWAPLYFIWLCWAIFYWVIISGR